MLWILSAIFALLQFKTERTQTLPGFPSETYKFAR